MTKNINPLDETHIDSRINDDSMTVTIVEASSDEKQFGHEKLIGNYHALIAENAIYYPAAYSFQRELGQGRQGKVFLGFRQGARGSLTRHAIKIFDPSIYSTTQKYWTDMGRIASQLSTLQTLRSPHLASLESYDEVNGIGYVQMELIRGMDLRQLLNGEHLKTVKDQTSEEKYQSLCAPLFRFDDDNMSVQPGVAIYIMRMMLKGLEDLHNAGFLHSDLKPANVMLNRLGYLKLIDFGRAVRPNEPTNMLLGTLAYMAPEVHRRERATIQSDLYGVGMVGIELLTGLPLVNPKNLTEEQVLDFKMTLYDRLHEILPEYVRSNKQFVDVLKKFIHPDQEKRYKNAEEAETEGQGLRIVHKQLAMAGKDADYSRVVGEYMSRYMNAIEQDRRNSPLNRG